MTRTQSTPSRRAITDRVVVELEKENFPVGEVNKPSDPFGWQGEPNSEGTNFIPWMVTTPGNATPQTPPGAMGDTGAMWRMTYSIFYAGVTTEQTERLADRVRFNLCNIAREKVLSETGDWQIMKIGCTSIGQMNRVGAAIPYHFTENDVFEVLLSKA